MTFFEKNICQNLQSLKFKMSHSIVKVSVPERIAAGTAGPCCSAAWTTRWRAAAGTPTWAAWAHPRGRGRRDPYPGLRPRPRPCCRLGMHLQWQTIRFQLQKVHSK